MQELIQFIRQQLVLCLRLLELLQQQRSALVHTEPAAVGGLTKDIEIVVIDLNRLEKQRQEFLRRHHSGDAAQWLAKQPPGLEKSMAEQLLAKQAAVLDRLKEASGSNMAYLSNNMTYIDYNINVLTGTAAGVTYGQPDAGRQDSVQGSKMFEANV